MENSCSICLDPLDSEFNLPAFKCSHIVHLSCARKWFNAQTENNITDSCPSCRARTANLGHITIQKNKHTSPFPKIALFLKECICSFDNHKEFLLKYKLLQQTFDIENVEGISCRIRLWKKDFTIKKYAEQLTLLSNTLFGKASINVHHESFITQSITYYTPTTTHHTDLPSILHLYLILVGYRITPTQNPLDHLTLLKSSLHHSTSTMISQHTSTETLHTFCSNLIALLNK